MLVGWLNIRSDLSVQILATPYPSTKTVLSLVLLEVEVLALALALVQEARACYEGASSRPFPT